MVSESVSHGGALPYNWMIENTIAPVTNADGSPGLSAGVLYYFQHTARTAEQSVWLILCAPHHDWRNSAVSTHDGSL